MGQRQIVTARKGPGGFSSTLVVGLAFCLFLPCVLSAASRPPVRGTGGAVASDEVLATEVGLEILAAGGNAVDSAVATALALAVVSPEAGNLGGGGFAVVKMGDEIAFLDFRETAPAAAFRELYLDETREPIAEASVYGPLAAGVPGSPAGLHALHRRFGKLSWPAVVAPAIGLAIDGFPVGDRLVEGLEEEKEALARFPETAHFWLDDGEPLELGLWLRLPSLARTLERYAAEGPAGVMEGPVAAAVVEVSKRHGGILELEDLATYEPVWRRPLLFEAFGWQLAGVDLPSSGGILTAAALAMAEAAGVAETERFGAERGHLLAEVWRRAFADRFLLGDPATTQASAAELLAPEHLERRLGTFDRGKATPSSDISAWAGVEPPAEPSDTTHLSVVDGAGNLVALTTTINGLFGCALWVPEAGFFLNNEMDDFAAAPGQPNLYGLIQGEANAVGAGKRMLSSQSPTIAWRQGEALALGGRGGSRIPTAVLQVLLNLWIDGDSLQQAIERPRIHHQWLVDQIEIEDDALSPETRRALEALGHVVNERDYVAQVHAVRWQVGGKVEAAADPRRVPGEAGVLEPSP